MQKTQEVLAKGAQLLSENKPEEALPFFEAALAKTIKLPNVLFLTGTCYSLLEKHGTAMNLLMRAIDESEPDAPWLSSAWLNLGVCFRKEAHEEEAKKAYMECIKLKPDTVEAWANLAGVYVNYGDPNPGIEYAKEALKIDPYNAQAAHHLGMLLLEDHQYEEGWKYYNARLRLHEFHARKFDCPEWFGGETGVLAIHGEQGIGDEIMFASLIPEAQKYAKRVVIECTERLIPIFERSFNVKCYPDHETLLKNEKPDSWAPLGSLPAVFNISKPLEHQGYIKPDPERVAAWKQRFPGPRVGFSWRGGTKATHMHLRNLPLEWWKPLINPGFISLQYGEWNKDAEELGLLKPETESFDDHLALVAACDLVVTVCNTTVHEAGATNTPCIVLVPNKPAWRYGTRGEGMLWYPSVKMYRQTTDWKDVFERVSADLEGIQGTQQTTSRVAA